MICCLGQKEFSGKKVQVFINCIYRTVLVFHCDFEKSSYCDGSLCLIYIGLYAVSVCLLLCLLKLSCLCVCPTICLSTFLCLSFALPFYCPALLFSYPKGNKAVYFGVDMGKVSKGPVLVYWVFKGSVYVYWVYGPIYSNQNCVSDVVSSMPAIFASQGLLLVPNLGWVDWETPDLFFFKPPCWENEPRTPRLAYWPTAATTIDIPAVIFVLQLSDHAIFVVSSGLQFHMDISPCGGQGLGYCPERVSSPSAPSSML